MELPTILSSKRKQVESIKDLKQEKEPKLSFSKNIIEKELNRNKYDDLFKIPFIKDHIKYMASELGITFEQMTKEQINNAIDEAAPLFFYPIINLVCDNPNSFQIFFDLLFDLDISIKTPSRDDWNCLHAILDYTKFEPKTEEWDKIFNALVSWDLIKSINTLPGYLITSVLKGAWENMDTLFDFIWAMNQSGLTYYHPRPYLISKFELTIQQLLSQISDMQLNQQELIQHFSDVLFWYKTYKEMKETSWSATLKTNPVFDFENNAYGLNGLLIYALGKDHLFTLRNDKFFCNIFYSFEFIIRWLLNEMYYLTDDENPRLISRVDKDQKRMTDIIGTINQFSIDPIGASYKMVNPLFINQLAREIGDPKDSEETFFIKDISSNQDYDIVKDWNQIPWFDYLSTSKSLGEYLSQLFVFMNSSNLINLIYSDYIPCIYGSISKYPEQIPGIWKMMQNTGNPEFYTNFLFSFSIIKIIFDKTEYFGKPEDFVRMAINDLKVTKYLLPTIDEEEVLDTQEGVIENLCFYFTQDAPLSEINGFLYPLILLTKWFIEYPEINEECTFTDEEKYLLFTLYNLLVAISETNDSQIQEALYQEIERIREPWIYNLEHPIIIEVSQVILPPNGDLLNQNDFVDEESDEEL